jgi:hypothetical protein
MELADGLSRLPATSAAMTADTIDGYSVWAEKDGEAIAHGRSSGQHTWTTLPSSRSHTTRPTRYDE